MPPNGITITEPLNGSHVSNASKMIIGTADPSSYVSVKIDGVEYVGSADEFGDWSISPDAQADGVISIE